MPLLMKMSKIAIGLLLLLLGVVVLLYAYKAEYPNIKESHSSFISFCKTLSIGLVLLVVAAYFIFSQMIGV